MEGAVERDVGGGLGGEGGLFISRSWQNAAVTLALISTIKNQLIRKKFS
jgi:hypothetical protein